MFKFWKKQNKTKDVFQMADEASLKRAEERRLRDSKTDTDLVDDVVRRLTGPWKEPTLETHAEITCLGHPDVCTCGMHRPVDS